MKSIFRLLNELVLLFLIIASIFISSCSHQVEKNKSNEDLQIESSEPAIEDSFEITQQPALCVVSFNQAALLTCKAESTRGDVFYQWYECDDISGKNPKLIDDAVSVHQGLDAYKDWGAAKQLYASGRRL